MQHDDAINRLHAHVLPNGNHETIAKQIAEDCTVNGEPGLMVLDNGESFYRYDPTSGWNPLARGEMEQLLITKCSSYHVRGKKDLEKVTNTKRSRAEVLDFLKYNYALQENRSALPKYNGQSCSPHHISVQNGIFDLKTKALIPHSPRLLTISRLPIAWKGSLEPREWLQFLESSIPAEEDRQLLQMWMGYLLTPDTKQQKMMWLIGRKRSGKGTILRIISELLGHLSAGTQLESLGTEYGLQNLYDKSSITIGDAEISKKDQAMLRARLLSIVGEDEVVVNRKHRDLLHLKLPGRLTLAANRNIPFENADGALSARMLCIHFPNSFMGQEDLTLLDRLTEELPAILAWCTEGWTMLQAAGRFPSTASTQNLYEANEFESDPCREWLNDHYEMGEGGVFMDDLYAEYKSAMEGKETILNRSVVGKKVGTLFSDVKRTKRTHITGERLLYYMGLVKKPF